MRNSSRREFLQLMAGVPFMDLADLARVLTAVDIIHYGFTTTETLAYRQPGDRYSFARYDKGALMRYQPVFSRNDWAQIINDPSLHFPERELAHGDIYVSRGDLQDLAPTDLVPIHREITPLDKEIEVILSRPQRLIAREGTRIFLESKIIAGLKDYTPRGEFNWIWKTKARYMQGKNYDLPGVPFVAYFTDQGHAFHGAYWKKDRDFGRPGSHGCINLPVEKANLLWRWGEKGVRIIIHD